jgi:hypothetical protein
MKSSQRPISRHKDESWCAIFLVKAAAGQEFTIGAEGDAVNGLLVPETDKYVTPYI